MQHTERGASWGKQWEKQVCVGGWKRRRKKNWDFDLHFSSHSLAPSRILVLAGPGFWVWLGSGVNMLISLCVQRGSSPVRTGLNSSPSIYKRSSGGKKTEASITTPTSSSDTLLVTIMERGVSDEMWIWTITTSVNGHSCIPGYGPKNLTFLVYFWCEEHGAKLKLNLNLKLGCTWVKHQLR